MSRKTIPFKMPAKPTDPAERWVAEREAAPMAVPSPSESMKRFTIDVAEDLHKRIKAQCAMRGVKMADVMRELLEREFPKA